MWMSTECAHQGDAGIATSVCQARPHKADSTLAVGHLAERSIDSLTPSSLIFHDFSAGMDSCNIRTRIDITRNYRFGNEDPDDMWRVRG